jgi:hypothetical protein
MAPIGTRYLRRPFAWLLIVQQLLAGAGVLLPCPPAAAGSGERYPCEHCGCGCRSAEQCWTHCSCFTFEEKVAWARRNGIAVPEYAVAAAKREAAAPRKPACAHAHCHHRGVPQAGGASHDARTRNHAEQEQGRDKDRSSHRVSLLNALRCHGLTQQWQAVRESWPGDRHVELWLVLLPRGCVEPWPFLRHLFFASPPPTPPPNAE